MKPTEENNIRTNECGQIDVDYYIRKAHKLRSEALAVNFSKRKKNSANDIDPKPTMPRAA